MPQATRAPVTPLEMFRAVDLRRPEQMPSLPAWAASRIVSVKIERQRHPITDQWREAPTLPSSLMLTVSERDEVQRHLDELEALLRQTPINDPRFEDEALLLVTQIMVALPSATRDELAAEARGMAAMVALDDIPVWALRSGVRHWYRGDCGPNERGQPYDYRWCPAPAELRRIAWAQTLPIRDRIRCLKRLLAAEPLIEFDEEHRALMLKRYAELLRHLEIPLVGTDGSSGAVGEEPSDVPTVGRSQRQNPA